GGFDARLDWGKMYLEKGLVDSACFWFHAAATIKPDNPEVWYQLSVTEQARGNIATAFSYAEKALAETPYDGNVLTQLGILYQKSGQAQKALQCFRQAYRYEPASYLSALNLGREFQTLKIYDSAVFYMNQSLALSDGILDDDSRFLTQLGYLELGLNQLDSALVHTQLALKVTANDITVNRQLGIILNQMNRNPEALTYFREAYRLSPGSILEIINLGLAFEKSGHYDSAYQYLYKGVEQGGAAVKNPIFYRALFNSCLALGKTDKARQLLNELESFAPDFRDLDEMRRRFKENGG
ncbi:MAG: tetratricopeptide repeat protein, partial [Candidatus Zixiibacteriota bacterium]